MGMRREASYPFTPVQFSASSASRTFRHVAIKVDIAGETSRHKACKNTAGGEITEVLVADKSSSEGDDPGKIDPEPCDCRPSNSAKETKVAALELVEIDDARAHLVCASSDKNETHQEFQEKRHFIYPSLH